MTRPFKSSVPDTYMYMLDFYKIVTCLHPDILSKRLLLGLAIGGIIGQCNQVCSIFTTDVAPTFSETILHTMITSWIGATICICPIFSLMYVPAGLCLMAKYLSKN